MGRGMNALRYAALEGEVSAGPDAPGETCEADFEAVVAEFGRMTADDERKRISHSATRADANGAHDSASDSAAIEPSSEPRDEQRAGPRARPRDGSKTAAKLEARMRRRAERMALDAARHQELMDNRELRQARSLTRRWFVLGRAIDAALAHDPDKAALLRAWIEPHITRPDERALLGWAREPDVSQS